MVTFSTVKRIGEGSYLNEEWFIIERVRKERALNMRCIKLDSKDSNRYKPINVRRNEKPPSS